MNRSDAIRRQLGEQGFSLPSLMLNELQEKEPFVNGQRFTPGRLFKNAIRFFNMMIRHGSILQIVKTRSNGAP